MPRKRHKFTAARDNRVSSVYRCRVAVCGQRGRSFWGLRPAYSTKDARGKLPVRPIVNEWHSCPVHIMVASRVHQ